jgi:arsenate reductase-like glutaredoxin family protein
MVDDIPYGLKYGPLIECLTGQSERAWLRDYPPEIAEHFRKLDERAIREYLKELQADFETLYRSALPAALDDPILAERLSKAWDEMFRFERLVRSRSRLLRQNQTANLKLRALLTSMQALQSFVLRPIL